MLPSRNATEERHGGDEKSKSFKQTYYIVSGLLLSGKGKSFKLTRLQLCRTV